MSTLQGIPQPIEEVVALTTRTTPARMAPGLLEYALTVDQVTAVGPSGNWERSLAYFGNRVLTVTPVRASWQTWRNGSGDDLREIKSLDLNLSGVTVTSTTSTVRPQLRTFDDNRVVMLHAGSLYVFDDRGFTMTSLATGIATPGDPYTANPRLAVVNGYIVVFPNATGATQGSSTALVYSLDPANAIQSEGGVTIGTSVNAIEPGYTTLGFDSDSGLVVLAATGVRGTNRVVFLYRNGAGSGVRYYVRTVDVSTGALGPENYIGLAWSVSPEGSGFIEEIGDYWQTAALAEDPISGVYIGLMAKRARRFTTSGSGGGTLPGVRVFQLQLNGDTVAIQLDGSRRIGSESLSTSRQFCYEQAYVAKDNQTRWSFDGFGDNGTSKAVALRLLPGDIGSFLAVRQLLGVDVPTIEDTFDLATIVLPWVQLLPIPAPPRATIPKPPSRAYYLAGVSPGPLRARVYHRSRGRGALKVRPDAMVQNYEDATRPF